MQKILTNSEIINLLIEQSGCDNPNQFAAYLSEKYDANISRQSIKQFQNSTALTLTSLLLREAIKTPNK